MQVKVRPAGSKGPASGVVKPEKLRLWQDRLKQADNAYGDQVAKMDHREALYQGTNKLKPLVEGEKGCKHPKTTSHVRNIVFENIETQISSSIPQPKVTPRRAKDEDLAAKIEHLCRNLLDQIPTEMLNDMAERTVPIQGGVGYLLEWDNAKRTHDTIGELAMSVIHPKQFAPQPGVYTGLQDMDWFIIKRPTTKLAIWNRYRKSVYAEGESEPEVRASGDADHSDDAVTQYVGFAVNDRGGLDKYSWVNDVELEDLEDYQARHQPVCVRCGKVRPLTDEKYTFDPAEAQENMAAQAEAAPEVRIYDGKGCPWCGGEEFRSEPQEKRTIQYPRPVANMPGVVAMETIEVPVYSPNIFPMVLQKSVSVFGQLLGNSDVDVIEDQQNTINRMEQKIIDRLVKAGTRITLPNKANLKTSPVDGERWYLENPADKAMIDVYEFSGNLQYELSYINMVYEEARQLLGITDSFQGRRDPTATSGVAKQQSAAQAAGRMESKRIMKNAAYAQIFELMFKFSLAYADEPRPISYKDQSGNTIYEEFNRLDFLEQDANGKWYWNDQFIFSTDTSAPLASNRETMWQETRMNLQTGAFGDPTKTETLILFWTKMEELHYPGAGATKQVLETRAQQEQAQMMAMQKMQMEMQMRAYQNPNMTAQGAAMPGTVPATL